MRVIFLKFMPNVGHVGDIKDVSDAYARNVLIPQKIVRKITPEEEKNIKEMQKKLEKQRIELIENRHKLQEILNGKIFEFKVKTDEKNKKMYGSISEKDIIDYIRKNFNIELSKKHIDFGPDGHIKKLGTRYIFINFGHDSVAKITIKTKA